MAARPSRSSRFFSRRTISSVTVPLFPAASRRHNSTPASELSFSTVTAGWSFSSTHREPERLQDHGRIFRTEEECRVGRAFLYDLQQYVLVLLCQNGAVRKDIDLPGTLVGPDIGIGADLADGVHGEVLMGLVPDGDNVRVNAGEHLAAGGTCPAMAFVRRPDTPWPQQRTARRRSGPRCRKTAARGKVFPVRRLPGSAGQWGHWQIPLDRLPSFPFPAKMRNKYSIFHAKREEPFFLSTECEKFSIPY